MRNHDLLLQRELIGRGASDYPRRDISDALNTLRRAPLLHARIDAAEHNNRAPKRNRAATASRPKRL
jgi:hypothetical protein